jgi:hypothetical protein
MATETKTSGRPVNDDGQYVDIDGNVIDAPTIRSFELEMYDAQNRADEADIADVQKRYHEARDRKVRRDNELAKKKRQSNEDEK